MLYSKSDRATLKKRIADTFPEKDYIRTVYEHLNYYYQMAMGDGLGCTREFNIDEFCRNFKHFPIQVDSALKILTRAGYLEYTDEQDNNSRLMFTLTKEELYRIHETSPETEKLINIILRSYTGVFTEYAYINEETLSLRAGMTRQQVYDTLISLTRRRILHYIPGKKTPYIIYTRERQEADRLVFTKEVYEDRKESFIHRIGAMTEYAETDDKCRSRMLLLYFGEKNEHNCGQCDVCLSSHSSGIRQGMFDEISRAIEEALKDKEMTTSELMEHIASYEKENVAKALSYLLSEEIIHQKNGRLSLPK